MTLNQIHNAMVLKNCPIQYFKSLRYQVHNHPVLVELVILSLIMLIHKTRWSRISNSNECLMCTFASSNYKFKAHPTFAETPTFQWSFLADDRPQDKGLYSKLQRRSVIWVRKAELSIVKDHTHSVKQYAKWLMWKVLVSVDDLLEIRHLKSKGIGFTKLFGKNHLNSVYGKSNLVFCIW